MTWLVWTNAILVIAAVWALAGGDRLRSGNWLMALAAGAGILAMAEAHLWPLVGMNVALAGRSLWVLWRMGDG